MPAEEQAVCEAGRTKPWSAMGAAPVAGPCALCPLGMLCWHALLAHPAVYAPLPSNATHTWSRHRPVPGGWLCLAALCSGLAALQLSRGWFEGRMAVAAAAAFLQHVCNTTRNLMAIPLPAPLCCAVQCNNQYVRSFWEYKKVGGPARAACSCSHWRAASARAWHTCALGQQGTLAVSLLKPATHHLSRLLPPR